MYTQDMGMVFSGATFKCLYVIWMASEVTLFLFIDFKSNLPSPFPRLINEVIEWFLGYTREEYKLIR